MIKEFLTHQLGLGTGIPVEELYDKYLTPESEILNIHGMPLHYRKTGSGPALLLIHGIGSCLHTWNKWHDILSDDFTVISLDLPGFGLTGPPPDKDFDVERYMETFDHLLNHLNIKKATIAGNSLGGYMAWNYAAKRPARVNKAVLLNAAGYNTSRRDLSDFGFLLSILPVTKELTHRFTPLNLVRQSLENAVADSSLITDAKVKLYHDHILREGNRESFSEVLSTLIVNEMDNNPEISTIDCPVLIMWGGKDALINVEDALKFDRALANSELIIYREIGHLPMLEIPERSAEDVRTFVHKNVKSRNVKRPASKKAQKAK